VICIAHRILLVGQNKGERMAETRKCSVLLATYVGKKVCGRPRRRWEIITKLR
jgi:hypothetical protein